MKIETLFEYGDEGKITVTYHDEDDIFSVYAKAYVTDEYGMEVPGTGIGDEGSF